MTFLSSPSIMRLRNILTSSTPSVARIRANLAGEEWKYFELLKRDILDDKDDHIFARINKIYLTNNKEVEKSCVLVAPE